jgi:hypothetical protein
VITGEIKVNEHLTLLRWQATNEGKHYTKPDTTMYRVTVGGIYGGQHTFVDDFELDYQTNLEPLGLVLRIHEKIAGRMAEGLTRRPPVE